MKNLEVEIEVNKEAINSKKAQISLLNKKIANLTHTKNLAENRLDFLKNKRRILKAEKEKIFEDTLMN